MAANSEPVKVIQIRHDVWCNVARWDCETCGYLRCWCATHRVYSNDHCRCNKQPEEDTTNPERTAR